MSSKRPHHDHEELRPKTSQEVRSQRLSDLSEAYEITVKIKGENVHLLNISETGLGFLSNKELAVNADLGNAEILVNGELFFESRVHVKRMSKTDKGFEIGCAFTDGAMPEDAVIALNIAGDTLAEMLQRVNEKNSIPDEFVLLINRAQSGLEIAKKMIDDLQDKVVINSIESQRSFEKAVEVIVSPPIVQMALAFSLNLHKQVKAMTPELRNVCSNYMRERLSTYFLASPFVNRAFRKPLGYAGDYEMMNQIYRNQFEGATWFGKILHKYSVNEASGHSVRFRKEFFKQEFLRQLQKKDTITVGALASGPARELVEFVAEADEKILKRIKFFLMDQDVEALLNSKRNIMRTIQQRKIDVDISFNPVSVKCLLKKEREYHRVADLRFDLIYTAGLYDYLPEPVAAGLTSRLIELLKSGGELIVGNFTADTPTATITEIVADWHLIHRSEDEMRKIMVTQDIAETTAHYDELGIELLLRVKKR